MHLLREIEKHLRRTGTPPTAFGRAVVKDPRFVFDLRNGREPREKTVRLVQAYLEQQP
jgi:2,4-dienoyl-CoA reductase-like NADH-dependent reductase (Old Yellow Enzyme family)